MECAAKARGNGSRSFHAWHEGPIRPGALAPFNIW